MKKFRFIWKLVISLACLGGARFALAGIDGLDHQDSYVLGIALLVLGVAELINVWN